MNVAIPPLIAATAALMVLPASTASADEASRLARRVALVAELLGEGAAGEAVAEAARLRADMPDAADAALVALAPFLSAPGDSARDTAESPTPQATPRGGVGGWLARRVVGFYRLFIGPAIGDRCVLEPSCSRYCLQATRKHGIVGVPMTADRFIREPNASAPDRPWVRTPSGQWRHPDPVKDHDFWFAPNPDRGPSSP